MSTMERSVKTGGGRAVVEGIEQSVNSAAEEEKTSRSALTDRGECGIIT